MDPAIEPESGERWETLFRRLWPLYLAALATNRDLLDRVTRLEQKATDGRTASQ